MAVALASLRAGLGAQKSPVPRPGLNAHLFTARRRPCTAHLGRTERPAAVADVPMKAGAYSHGGGRWMFGGEPALSSWISGACGGEGAVWNYNLKGLVTPVQGEVCLASGWRWGPSRFHHENTRPDVLDRWLWPQARMLWRRAGRWRGWGSSSHLTGQRELGECEGQMETKGLGFGIWGCGPGWLWKAGRGPR